VGGPVVGLEAVEEVLEFGAEDFELDGGVGREAGAGDGGDEVLDDGLGGGVGGCHFCWCLNMVGVRCWRGR